ncbi:MAG TPA: LysM domain-containing protein [Polyangiaceae bacterium]|jgi:N-acetylmuramoyl-L-alanine amidase
MATTHVVQQGECLTQIAQQYGFADHKAIYDHPDNADFKQARPSPNILYPGDVLQIPDPEKKSADCATGDSYRFVVRRPTRNLHIVFTDVTGTAVAGAKYVLVAGDDTRMGTTGGDGAVDEKGIGLSVQTATLEFPDLGIRRILNIGQLDPHDSDSGWRQRLVNLGYSDDEDGLAAFCVDQGVPDGTDGATIVEKLRTIHRS